MPPGLQDRLGRNEFPGHGYNQFLLDGNWISAAATFDAELCNRLKVPIVEFDGRNDALLPAQSLDGGPYIEYIEYYGTLLPCRWILSPNAPQKSGGGTSVHGGGLRMIPVFPEPCLRAEAIRLRY